MTFDFFKSEAATHQSEKLSTSQFPARISLAYQFERAAQVVEASVSRGDAIQALHKQTAQQLDATEYALHRLFDEIHSVLPRFEKPVYSNAIVRTAEAEAFRPTALAA